MKTLLLLLAALLCGQHVMAICSTSLNNTLVCGGHGTCIAGACTCALQYTGGNSLTAAGALGTHGVLATYAVIAATTITNSGSSVMRGNAGVTPANAVSGTALTFGSGAYHSNDASATNALADATAAAAYFHGLADTQGVPATALDGRTLTPGKRSMSAGATLTGSLTLNFQNDPSAMFIFDITGSLSTAANSHIVLINQGTSGSAAATGLTNSQVLGAASTYAVIASTPSITNGGTLPTEIWGNVAIHPAAVVPAASATWVVHGVTHAADATALSIKALVNTAIGTLNGLSATASIGVEIGGVTFTPGVYDVAGPTTVSTDMTLNGAGVYVFRLASSMSVSTGVKLVRLNGAKLCQVFFVVATGASLGTGSSFGGSLLAQTTVALGTSARFNGTIASMTAAVTLLSNVLDTGGGACAASSSSAATPCVGCECRVIWVTSTTATLGATSTFAGTLLSTGAVSAGTNARITGRLASLAAGVTLSTNSVNATTCSSLVSTCAACPAGTQGTAANVCSNCPIGKYKEAAVPVACRACQAHSNATTAGATQCTCFKGYAGNVVQYECTACHAGSYKTAIGNGGCTNCTGLHVTTATAASTLATACGCDLGYFGASGGIAPCSKCDQGSFTDTIKSTACTNCSLEGFAAIGSGAASCEACPAGSTNNTGNTLCSVDIDECASAKLNNCTNADCVNTAGNYTCTCHSGYFSTDGWTVCAATAGVGSDSYIGRVVLIVAGAAVGVLVLAGFAYGSQAVMGGKLGSSSTEFSRVGSGAGRY